MKLITIQHEEVFKKLLEGQVYYANTTNAKNLQAPYQKMIEYYGWDNTKAPIFACVVGEPFNFIGRKTENAYVLTLEVPDKEVKLQAYYNWTDMIYFMETPNTWHEETGASFTLEEHINNTLSGSNIKFDNQIQATIPCIKPEWLASYTKYKQSFDNYIEGEMLEEVEEWPAADPKEIHIPGFSKIVKEKE